MRVFLAALALVAGSTPGAAQWLDRPWPGIPRTADGKPNLSAPAPRGPDGKPDLTGIWDAGQIVGRPKPEDLQPWVLDLARKHQQELHRQRPYYQCLPSGPEAERYGGESSKRILHTPTMIAILNDDLTYRVIHIDGRQLEADPAPSWMGYSVGRWEGDTLVVESNGYNEKTWTSRYGVSHSDKLRVIERYRRTNFGSLQLEVTYHDPSAYLKPWGFTATMSLTADTEMLEAVCERSSDHWANLSDAASTAVKIPRDALARYVGVYKGIYGRAERTYDVSLSGDQLIAKIVGPAIEGGLAAAGLEEGAPRRLVPLTQTVFEGDGLAYQFEIGDTGPATALIVIHISGPYRYARQP
jgi:hypothetical protein